MFSNWGELDTRRRINLIDEHATRESVLELISFLSHEYDDPAKQVEAARLLSETALFSAARGGLNRRPITVASYYHHILGGGIETALVSMAREVGDGVGRSVILADRVDGTFARSEHVPDGLDVVQIGESAEGRYERLASALADVGADVLVHHAWFDRTLLWDIVLCRVLGVRFVLNVHGVFSHFVDVSDASFVEWNDGRLFASVAYAAQLADAVIGQSAVNKRFFSHFNPNSFAVPHKLPERYGALVGEPRSKPEAPKLLWVGRFDEYKHPEDALDVLALVRRECADARLVYVGGGNGSAYEDELRARAVEMGFGQAVDFEGFLEDVAPYYLDAAVLLLTTEIEGFCMVLAEACACGLPVVAYDLPFVPFAACEGIRWVAEGDAASAAHAACELLGDEEAWLEASRAGQRFVGEGLYRNLPDTFGDVLLALGYERPERADSGEREVWDTLLAHYLRGQRRAHEQLERERARACELERSLDECRSGFERSASYRLGRMLTAVPRKISGRN